MPKKSTKKKLVQVPQHPGFYVKALADFAEMSVRDLATASGISQPTLNLVTNGKGRITPALAMKLGQAITVSPMALLALQAEADVRAL